VTSKKGTVRHSGLGRLIFAFKGTVAVIASSICFGTWLTTQLWQQTSEKHTEPMRALPQAGQIPELPPKAAADAGNSVLGTDGSISKERLQLVLVSTAPAQTLQEGTANIGVNRRNAQTYSGGAVLSNGARIEEIHTDRVVLSLRGHRTTLMTNGTVISESGGNWARDTTTVGGAPELSLAEDRFVTSREDLSEHFRTQPVFEDDRFVGLRVLTGTKSSALRDLGLESGDVIRTVEGRLISSDAAWQEIDDAFTSGTSILLGIERDGTLLNISLDSTKLASSGEATPAISMPPPT
jgi:hypothetical protein